jgi:signal transduction histidine kinase
MPLLPPAAPELSAALFQATITGALAALAALLFQQSRKPWFAWWAGAWLLYLLRLGAIISFIVSGDRLWLYWHQVATGWVALGLLWAALVFSRPRRWRPAYLIAALFPVAWSYVAIYRLGNFFGRDAFLLAAVPAVLFLSAATLWTGWVFLRYWREVRSGGALLLAVAFLLWGLHHLDYPFLRARGAWVPWGYYLDVLFELAVAAGTGLLVLDDLRRAVQALSGLSGDLVRGARDRDLIDAILARPLTLPAVRGSALYLRDAGRFVRGAGACGRWAGAAPADESAEALESAMARGRPRLDLSWPTLRADFGAGAGAAVLPVFHGDSAAATGALVLVADARDPFTALDERFLVALGEQVGIALENADLYGRLEARTVELARLSARMVEQHEEERRRLSRELHDETAQVFSAVKMELGLLRTALPAAPAGRLDRALELVDTGLRSIRSVVNDLRPSLLDDLGLLPALRSLVTDFAERSGIRVALEAPAALPPLSKDAELALFRALQEALANVVRHADARTVDVDLVVEPRALHLAVRDDGRGPPGDAEAEALAVRLERDGHMGLAGMRERIAALGGSVRFGRWSAAGGGGARLEVRLPLAGGAS